MVDNPSKRGSMRRVTKAMPQNEALEFLADVWVARLGTSGADGFPYVIPVNIAYDKESAAEAVLGTVFFHSALEGHKLDNISINPKVCLQADDGGRLISKGQRPCDYSAAFVSIVAFGTARIVEGASEHRRALELIAAASGAPANMGMDESVIARTRVIAVDLELITGKRSG